MYKDIGKVKSKLDDVVAMYQTEKSNAARRLKHVQFLLVENHQLKKELDQALYELSTERKNKGVKLV